MEKNCLLKISNLAVEYRTGIGPVKALDNVSLQFPGQGESLGLVGESGSGKTTLAMSILNLIEQPGRIIAGLVEFNGRNVLAMSESELRRYRWEDVSMVYQSAMDSLSPVRTVSHPIIEVIRKHKGLSRSEAKQIAQRSLQDVGIPSNRIEDYPYELSGGMRQRVVIALALVLSPKLLIADEPTSALDVVTQRQILKLIKNNVKQKGLSLIFITHEISLLNGLVENIAVMYRGEIVEEGKTWDLLKNPKHPYTEILVASILTPSSQLRSYEYLSSLASRRAYGSSQNACKYVSRCRYAFDRCTKERPNLNELEDGRLVACHKYT